MQNKFKKMKKHIIYKVTTFIIILLFSTTMINNNKNIITLPIIKPIYDNILGTVYNAEVRQCDATPTITGDGSKINQYKASEYRWIAISQEMLDCEYRIKLLNDSTSILYKGKIEYGDTIWIDSSYETINGWWVVHDTMNKRYRNRIDFLQTKGDGNLYNNNPLWNGKFDNIRIYTINDAEILGLINKIT